MASSDTDAAIAVMQNDISHIKASIASINASIANIDAQHSKLSETIYTTAGQMDIAIPLLEGLNSSLHVLMIGGGITVVVAGIGIVAAGVGAIVWHKFKA